MNIEKTLLSFCLKNKDGFLKTKLSNINPSHFIAKSCINIYNIVSLFFSQYKRLPVKDELIAFTNNIDLSKTEKKDISLLLEEIYSIDIEGIDIDFLIDDFLAKNLKYKYESALQEAMILTQKGFTKKSIDEIQSKLFHLSQYQKDAGKIIKLKDKAEEYKKTYGAYDEGYGITSGYMEIDEITNGWKPGDLICILSGTGEGKSTCLMNFAYNAYLNGKNILYIQLETDEKLLSNRIISKATKIPSTDIRMAKLDESQKEKLIEEVNNWETNKNNFYICDFNYNCTPEMIEAKVHELQTYHSIDLVVVDYLGIVSLPKEEKSTNMYLNKSLIAEKLKAMARKYELPFLTAQQVTRNATASKKEKYGLFDISMSFYITHHCDIVMSLKILNSDELEFVSEVETLISFEKNRQGKKDSVVFLIDFASMNMEVSNSGLI